MLNLREIYRPKTVEEALALLARPGSVPLAGGTELVAGRRRDVRAVVDLSDLGLAYIRDNRGNVAIGAMTTLTAVAESPILRAAANGVVAQAAHRSAASLLRNQATLGGTLIAQPAGILATALAAMDARVKTSPPALVQSGDAGVPIVEFLLQLDQYLTGAIMTELVIPAMALRRRGAIETVARTPRDKPIVVVCITVEGEVGVVRSASIAMGGIGETAVRATGAETIILGARLGDSLIERAAGEALKGILPSSDVRGSAEYRKEMVSVLTARVLRAIA